MTLSPDIVSQIRRRVATEPVAARALAAVRGRADSILAAPIPSVMDKDRAPASGNKHDYSSLGFYWWPNPATPDGLPYVRRDGKRNPEGEALDVGRLRLVFRGVRTLALVWAVSGDEKYAAHAAEMLRVWFLNDETAMTPHLEYAQAIPGVCTGRDIGIIDTSLICHRLLDGLTILGSYGAWPGGDQDGVRNWLARFTDWLRTSDHGRGESRRNNNHATWFDVQLLALALYLGDSALAAQTAEGVKARIASQIEPDGRQPEELARTLSHYYAVMNLEGMALLADMAPAAGVDLWNFGTPDGRSIRAAIEWLLPYMSRWRWWRFRQIKRINWNPFAPVLRRAARGYGADHFKKALSRLDETDESAAETCLLVGIDNART